MFLELSVRLITHECVISAIYHDTTKLHLDCETVGTARKRHLCLFLPYPPHVFCQKKNLKIQSPFANQLGNFPEHLAKLNIFWGGWVVNETVINFVVHFPYCI